MSEGRKCDSCVDRRICPTAKSGKTLVRASCHREDPYWRISSLEQSLAASQAREAAHLATWQRLAEATDPADFGCYDSDNPRQVFMAIKGYAAGALVASPAYNEWKAMQAVCEAAKEWCNLKDTQRRLQVARVLDNNEETEDNLSGYREVSAKIFPAYKRLREALAALEEVD